MMNMVTLTFDNVETEHICCAISDKKSAEGVAAKKEWLKTCMADGLRFKKLDARGKMFIEYILAQNAWMPIEADGYMLINCFWVSGSFKGKGHGRELLDACEKDSAGMKGVVVVVGNKKKPFLSDKGFFLKHGYEVCDTAHPYFELLVKRFDKSAAMPRFKPNAKAGKIEGLKGIDIFYTAQCPFTIPYIGFIQPVINGSDVPVRLHQFTNKGEAQQHFCPVTTYSVFVNGEYYTNEIFTPAKLEKIINQLK